MKISGLSVVGVVGGVLVIVSVLLAALPGERVARLVLDVLPPFAGKVEVKAIRLGPAVLLGLVTDAPTSLVIEGLRITDPEGTVVLAAPRLALKIRPRSATSAKIYVTDLELGAGSLWRFAQMKKSDAIGFMSWFATLPKEDAPPELPKAKPAKTPAADRFHFEIANASLDGLTAHLEFPAWGLELRNIKAPLTLLVDEEENAMFVGWDAQGLDARDGGWLRILEEVLPFDHVLVNRVATLRERPNDILLDLGAGRTGRSKLTALGHFTGIYGYAESTAPAGIDLHAEFANAADALGAVARRHPIPGLRIGGDDVSVKLDLKDAFERLKIDGAIERLDAAAMGYEARQLELAFAVDMGPPLALNVKRLAFGSPRGGKMSLQATLKDTAFGAALRFERFGVDSYIPVGLRTLAAGELHGRLALQGDFGETQRRVAVDDMDLTFQRRLSAGLPRRVRIAGRAEATPERVRAHRLRVEVPGASVSAQGQVDLIKQAVALSLRAAVSDMPRLLRQLGLPPLGQTADLSAKIDGRLDAPVGQGQLVVRGLGLPPFVRVPELDAKWSFAAGALRLHSLRGEVFGGTLEAKGQVQMFDRTLARPLRAPVVQASLDARQLDVGALLTQVVGEAFIKGRLDVSAAVSGPADRLVAKVTLPPGAALSVLGETWTLGGIEIESDLREVVVHRARLVRTGGGEVDATARLRLTGPGDVTWTLSVRDFPLAALPGVADAGVPIEGRLSAKLEGFGTLAQPAVRGEIVLRGVRAMDVALGDGRLELTSEEPGRVSLTGNLFDRFAIKAAAKLDKDGLAATGELAFERLVLERLVPQMTRFGDARGSVTGRVAVRLAPGKPLAIEVNLKDLELSAARPAAPGAVSPQRLAVRNTTPLRLTLEGSRIVLEESVLSTQGGELRLRATLDDDAVDASVVGFLNLELLQPFVGAPVDQLGGDLRLTLHARGPKARPRLEGQVAIAAPVRVKLAGFDQELTVPAGTVTLAPGVVTLKDLKVAFEGSTLAVGGKVTLDEQMKPTRFEVAANGELSAGLLETVAGGAITDASGKLRIEARVLGTPDAPEVDGRLTLGRIRMRLRDLGREVEVESGSVELKLNELLLKDVRAVVDGQGRLLIGSGGVEPGRVVFKRLYPQVEIAAVRLPLEGQGLTFSLPGSVVLDDLNFGMLLTGDPQDGFSLTGEMRVASGRYIRDFTMRAFVISPSVDESAAPSLEQGKSVLGDMALDLRVRTIGDSFMVQNNLAPEIHMILDLHVGGTVRRPQIAGDVRPTDGRFHIPGIHGDFVLLPNVNHVTFIETRSIAEAETPELNLEAENLVSDASGREHAVLMRITGPIGQARIDLSTDTGLDRSQTMLLLISGRTTDVGSSTAFGPNVSTGVDVVGQITRDSVADFLEPYIDDTLELLTGRKLNLRPTVGPDGFELRLGARVSRQLDLQLSFLRGFQAQRRYRAELSVWMMDYLSFRGFGQQLTQSPQQGIVEQVTSLNLELSFEFPLRFGAP